MPECPECKKVLQTADALKSHKKSHLLTCTLFGITIHKQGDQFPCPGGCKKAYGNPDSLRAHLKDCAPARAVLPAYSKAPTAPQLTSPLATTSTGAYTTTIASVGASDIHVTDADELPNQLVPASRSAPTSVSFDATGPPHSSPPSSSSGQKRDRPIEDQGEPRPRPNPGRSPSLSFPPNPTQRPPTQRPPPQRRGYTINPRSSVNVDAPPDVPPLVPLCKSSFPLAPSRIAKQAQKKSSSTRSQERNNAYERDYCIPIRQALEHLKDACGFCLALGSPSYDQHSGEQCLKTRSTSDREFLHSWKVFISSGIAFEEKTCYACTLPQYKGLHGYQEQAGRTGCPFNDGIKQVLFMLLHYRTLFSECELIPEGYRSVNDDPDIVSELKLWLLMDTLNNPDDPPYGPLPNYLRLFLWLVRNRDSQH